MSTRCTTPACSAAGSASSATLWVPKVTVTSARDGGAVELAGVHVDAGRYVDRDDRDAVERLERLLGLGPEAGSSADADDAVDDEVGWRSRAPA